MLRQLFAKLGWGTFLGDDLATVEGTAYQGGLIVRTAQTAAVMNSTRINRRDLAMLPDAQADVFEETYYGYVGPAAAQNRPEPYRYQYVTQDGYKGFVPWEILPQIPEANPWE